MSDQRLTKMDVISGDSLRERIRRWVMPTRTLGSYSIKMLLIRFFGILIGLSVVLQMLDLLAQSDAIMAADGATSDSILRYISLRLPQLVSQFAPFVMLLATLLTLASLNQSSEIVIMKAIGMSAHRILLPLGMGAAMIASLHFIFNETIVVNANAELDYWTDQEFAIGLPPAPTVAGRVWIKEGQHFLRIESVAVESDKVILDDIAVFERAGNGVFEELLRADFAWHMEGRWTLYNVRQFDVVSHQLTSTPSMDWPISTPPERFLALTVNPKHANFIELRRSIKKLEDEGLPTARLEASYYQKFAGPAAALLMPLLAAIAAFGVQRAGTLFVRLITGLALGFTYFVADNFMLAMGEFGVAPPFLAAWAPFFLFLFVGYAVLFNTEEGNVGRRSPVPDGSASGPPAQ